MELSPEKPKLITIMPQQKVPETVQVIKRKGHIKLNVSDYLGEKEKRISKKLSMHFGSDLLDFHSNSKKNKEVKYGRRGSFTFKPKIKKELLKDYKAQLKIEKKYRKLNITQNLSDSSFEESGEENEDIGLDIYISSESYFILVFDIFITFFTFYFLLFIPLKIADRKNYYTEQNKIIIIFNIITEILYIFDFLLSFFRTYYDYEYKKITDINKIIMNYITNDFFMDLIEAIPSYIICKKYCYKNIGFNSELSGFEIIMTILLMVKSLKILKVLASGGNANRAIEILHGKISENFFFEKLFNIFMFIFKIFSFMHILICIHLFLGWQRYPNWMTHINIMDEDLIIKYISSFYFIIETMTTVGYGDIICISPIERFFQLILLSIGIVSYSFIISKFTNYVMKQSKEEIELDKKMTELEQIRIQYPLIPYKLYMRIQNYFRKKSEKNNNKNEMTNLVNTLPDKLRNDMLLVIYRDVINKFYIFKGCNNTDFMLQMCSAFIQTTVGKETVLMPEGKKVENIIFVKDGRLILEAIINLANPSESYERYFRENFKSINLKTIQNMRNSVSNYNNSVIDYKQAENNNYITYLEEKLMDTNKIGKKRNSYFDATRNSVSFQIGDESEEEEQEQEKSDIIKEGVNYQHLKILDVRKNEHFGDSLLFLEKNAPLTLKVKSKKAVIFILKKKDALNINNIHHNIMNRIREKSLKNLIAIKNKTIDILKQYIGNKLNKMKRTQLQNASWFNEKSRNIAMQDITNFLNNSVNIIEKDDISPHSPLNANATPSRRSILKDIINARTPKRINNNKEKRESKDIKANRANTSFKVMRTINTPTTNNKLRKKIEGIKKNNGTEIRCVSSKNNFLHLNYEPKLSILNKLKNKSFSQNPTIESGKLKIDTTIVQSNKNFKYTSVFSKNLDKLNTKAKDKKKVKFKDFQDTESMSKDLKVGMGTLDVSSSDVPSPSPTPSEVTQEEEEEKTTTINDIITEAGTEIRKKIKSSVERQKILKLCQMQTKMIESYQKKMCETIKPTNKSYDMKEDNEINKISDLNNIIYNKLLEYLETEADTEMEGEKIKEIKYKTEKVISFNIKSSYSNLNNLTNGKIIINNNYKIDIKNLIRNYIKEKSKNSMNSLDYLVKKYYNQSQDLDQMTFHNVSPKSIKSPHRKRVKFMQHKSSKSLSVKSIGDKIPTKIISNKIKKTITNKIELYKNFKSMGLDIDDKLSQVKDKAKTKTKTINNSSSKLNIELENNSFQKTNSNSKNGFTRFINFIYSKLKGK